jgi:soluble lytic murein transglycosylase-like protein
VPGLVAALALLITGTGQAEELWECFRAAGERYDLSPALLQAIAEVESGLDPRAVHLNTDETTDLGIMQINSRWLPVLSRYDIEPHDLWDPCLNISVGAWILAGNIQNFGYSWRAVGAYNAGTGGDPATEQRREDYAIRVYRRLPCAAGRMCGDTAEHR